jgi:hypothetical protein
MTRAADRRDAGNAAPREAWVETYGRLSGRDPASLAPENLEALADAAWLLCRFGESIRARQKAYAGYLEARADQPAARMAWRLFWEHGPPQVTRTRPVFA